METTAPPAVLLGVVQDVARYPEWLDLVTKVEPDDGAWLVTLRANIGPFARSKRLRMIERPADANRFDLVRAETDGRNHAVWQLTSTVTPLPDGSQLALDLHYGGSLWTSALDSVLSARVASTKPRLLAYLDSQRAG